MHVQCHLQLQLTHSKPDMITINMTMYMFIDNYNYGNNIVLNIHSMKGNNSIVSFDGYISYRFVLLTCVVIIIINSLSSDRRLSVCDTSSSAILSCKRSSSSQRTIQAPTAAPPPWSVA